MVNTEYERAVARYGKDRAERLLRTMMSHYKRLVYIRMPNQKSLEPDREYAQAMAARFGLRYEEVDGTPEWLRRMMAQQWAEDFVVVQPGRADRVQTLLFILIRISLINSTAIVIGEISKAVVPRGFKE